MTPRPDGRSQRRFCDACVRAKKREKWAARPKTQVSAARAVKRAYDKAYREAHRERLNAQACASYARRRAAEPAVHAERGRRGHLFTRYRITPEAYRAMLDAQGGTCAVCRKPETRSRHGRLLLLVVDHDHETGAVRALLCHRCNSAIGYADDSPARLRAAAEYLERHGR